jgi:hypothetical protein
MSGGWVPPGGEPARPVLPAAGWYWDAGPAGRRVLRWWDGTAWAGVPSWPAPARPAPPGRVSAWLASPAASPLLAAVAAVTMIGWAGAAAVVAAAAAGHPVLPAVTVDMSPFVLLVANGAVLIGVQARRAARAGPALPAEAARAMRRAARRARRASFGPWAPVQAVWRLVRRPLRAFASLPRPIGWCFTAAVWLTVGVGTWVTWVVVESASQPHGWYWATGPGQLAALAWMMQLNVWSGMACGAWGRTRAAARMMPRVSAGSR